MVLASVLVRLSGMGLLQILLDDVLRDRAQDIARGMGLDLASAVRMFLHQMVSENALSFRQNMLRLRQSLA